MTRFIVPEKKKKQTTKNKNIKDFLEVQWLRLHLPVQGEFDPNKELRSHVLQAQKNKT